MSGLTWGLLVFSLCGWDCENIPRIMFSTRKHRCHEGSNVLSRTWGVRTIPWAACWRGKVRALPSMFLCDIPTEEIVVFLTSKNQKNTSFFIQPSRNNFPFLLYVCQNKERESRSIFCSFPCFVKVLGGQPTAFQVNVLHYLKKFNSFQFWVKTPGVRENIDNSAILSWSGALL